MSKVDTPVLFIVFNRPDTTAQVFEAIRQARPKQLFVAADGPRAHKPGEAEKSAEVRRIATAVDWDCEVKTLFQEQNLGCGVGPATAISWFFEHVEMGIILEDDCIPGASFFYFCSELLEYYKDNKQVAHIGGTNSQFGKKRGTGSYYFSMYPHIWGWATWKRAWSQFKFSFDGISDTAIQAVFARYGLTKTECDYWLEHWALVKEGARKDIWDIQWTFSCWLNGCVTIVPNVNLISNIGFNDDATHTVDSNSKLGNLKTGSLTVIRHPDEVKISRQADQFTFNNYNLLKPSNAAIVKNKIGRLLPKGVKKTIKSLLK